MIELIYLSIFASFLAIQQTYSIVSLQSKSLKSQSNFNYKLPSTLNSCFKVYLTFFQCLPSGVIIESCLRSLIMGIKILHLLIYSLIPTNVLHFLSAILMGCNPCLIFLTISSIQFKSIYAHLRPKNSEKQRLPGRRTPFFMDSLASLSFF